ncbi:hypothetical protein [Mycolicibacterium thermoresistibile]|uniref:Uncharacterized protein n=2 Tax=Mycolicibacterium thermoresistibile TaxID=1797 RepID=G7CHY9_MYCT3|nr:hypothetical protein [Mycolicibacterium thermoresistibile]EHI12449.1 hypothetical protein KEK_16158 [Mycolicibacterium thermoresistibile ATCC 19527]MCV7187367.1 hypothetical protein [Mycolicibacterium thermoresistibile]GAT17226.1 putative uncharacterized protein [Mycolicibacterium thermoresistibile]SNW19632.1 Uncharacterised protein [Mycolicibacterium thermoresistibile]
MTNTRRPAISDVLPEETLSYRDKLGEPHFTGIHLIEDSAYLVTGETDDHDIYAISLSFNVDGEAWGGKPAPLRQTNFMALPKSQRTKGLEDNDYVGVRSDPVRPTPLEVTRDGNKVIWTEGNIVTTADVPYWSIEGEHAGVHFDVTMGGLCEAARSLGAFSDLETNGMAGIEQPLWVEGTVSSGGESYELQRGLGMHQKVIIGDQWVHGANVARKSRHYYITVLDEDLRVFAFIKEATGVEFGQITINNNHSDFGEGQIEVTELAFWTDPRTGQSIPSKMSLMMKSEDTTVAVVLEAYGRFMYSYCQAESIISYYGLGCRANGTISTPEGVIQIKDVRTYIENGIYPIPLAVN